MTTPRELCDLLCRAGIDFFTGVPDSTFKALLRELEDRRDLGYVTAVAEDLAVGLAVGAYLGGRTPMVLMQNSGLALATNALASLATLYRVPMLLLVGWRGHDGLDAPEHLLTGEITPRLLELLGIPYRVLEADSVAADVRHSVAVMHERRIPVAIVLRKGVLT